MKNGYMLRPAALVAMAALVVGCGVGEAPTTSLSPDGANSNVDVLGVFLPAGGTVETAQPERLEVCKRYQNTVAPVPATTTFDFSATADGGFASQFSITSAANNVYACEEVWLDGGPGGNVTVTEPAIDGYKTFVTRIQDVQGNETTPVNNVETNTATGLVSGNPAPTGQLILFTNVEEVNEGGCTLTQGYWKTHSIYGPAAHPDAGWANVGGPDAAFFSSGMTWLELFRTPPKGGNVYIQLAHQYMAAKLNILSGATPTAAVTAAITAAETFFNSGATPTTTLTNTQKNALRGHAATLGSFNEGDIGPGHCQDAPQT